MKSEDIHKALSLRKDINELNRVLEKITRAKDSTPFFGECFFTIVDGKGKAIHEDHLFKEIMFGMNDDSGLNFDLAVIAADRVKRKRDELELRLRGMVDDYDDFIKYASF